MTRAGRSSCWVADALALRIGSDAFESGCLAGRAATGRLHANSGDHHADQLGRHRPIAVAGEAKANVLLTTEKDYVKLRDMPGVLGAIPIYRIGVRIELANDDAERLRELLKATMSKHAEQATDS